MRCLTIRQPWVWAILRGGKDVENRTNKRGAAAAKAQFNRPGPVLLHAGGHLDGQDAFRRAAALSRVEMPIFGAPGAGTATELGAFVALARIAGVHLADECWDPIRRRFCSPWADPNAAHIQLTDVRELAFPVEYPGRLGLWQIPAEDAHIAAAVGRQLA